MKEYLLDNIPDITDITKIRGEASTRSFYRFKQVKSKSQIAMIYPTKNKDEINRIVKFTALFKNNEINTPKIIETIDDRIIILEDLGTLSFQQAFNKSNKINKKKLLDNISTIISKLRNISLDKTKQVLGNERLKFEMDFFLKHYIADNLSNIDKDILQRKLYSIVDNISEEKIFSHRDFHSRNIHIFMDKIYLIDFQDSLQGPNYYDIVSFLNDSYVDLGTLRTYFFSLLKEQNIQIDKRQLYLTALQRNIKALGTFGYQINVRKNLSYKKYTKRTLLHIENNPEGELVYELIQGREAERQRGRE